MLSECACCKNARRPVDWSESAKVKVLCRVDLAFPSTEAVSVFPSGCGRTSAMKRSALVDFDLPVVCSVNSDSCCLSSGQEGGGAISPFAPLPLNPPLHSLTPQLQSHSFLHNLAHSNLIHFQQQSKSVHGKLYCEPAMKII